METESTPPTPTPPTPSPLRFNPFAFFGLGLLATILIGALAPNIGSAILVSIVCTGGTSLIIWIPIWLGIGMVISMIIQLIRLAILSAINRDSK